MTTTQRDETSPLPSRPFRETTRELLDRAATASRSYVVTRRSAEEFQARAAALLAQRTADFAGHDTNLRRTQLTVISDTCGQQTLVTSGEQQRRLSAADLEHRLSGKHAVLAARTEAAFAHLIDAAGEGCDEAFMLGATELSVPEFAACEAAFLRRAGLGIGAVAAAAESFLEETGLAALAHGARAELAPGNQAGERALRHGLAELERIWQRAAQLQTFGESVAELMNWPILDSVELPMSPAQWREFVYSRPLSEVRDRADVLGILPSWDARHARTAAGFYPVRGSIEYAIARSLAAAPHADVLWLVAASADRNDARRFAEAISARYPDKLLAYQLTTEAAEELAKLGAETVTDFTSTLASFGFSLHVMGEESACARLAGDCVHLT